MSIVKVHIDASAGIIEIEGDEKFVSEQLEKLLPILQQQIKKPTSNNKLEIDDSVETPEPEENGQVEKKKKRRAGNPPRGSSCRDRILTLKGDGFFKSHRSPTDIVEGLKKKGWTHNASQVSAALTLMFAKNELQRTGEGGKFKYYWDRG